MLTHELIENEGVLLVRPEGPLAAEDFGAVAQIVDPYLDREGQLKGLLIDASNFSGWKDFAGLTSHLKFVKQHHRQIRRVAALSDSRFFGALPSIVRHFVSARVRRFHTDERADALAWLAEDDAPDGKPHSIRFTEINEKPALWIEIDGRITREDYLELLGPMQEQIDEELLVSYLVEIKSYEGVECGALWEDVKFGIANRKHIRRLAVLGDEKWVEWFSKLADPVTHFPVRAFHSDEESEAWDWVTGEN